MSREEFEKLPEIANILEFGLVKFKDGKYVFLNSSYYLNCSASVFQHLGYLNGAWYAYQEQQKKIDAIVGIVRKADLSDGNSSVAIVHDEIQELLK